MNLYFWSIAVVIDGGFLNLPKFTAMVNGGTGDYNKICLQLILLEQTTLQEQT
jgi:hypothetical protein